MSFTKAFISVFFLLLSASLFARRAKPPIEIETMRSRLTSLVLAIVLTIPSMHSAQASDTRNHRASTWDIEVTKVGGDTLTHIESGDRPVPQFVINEKYAVQGQLPAGWMSQTKRTGRAAAIDKVHYVALEIRKSEQDEWRVFSHIPVDQRGRFEGQFTASRTFLGNTHIRARHLRPGSQPASGETDLSLSTVLTTTGVSQVNIKIINDTDSNLIFTVPTNYDDTVDPPVYGSEYSFKVDKNTSMWQVYRNVAEATAVYWQAKRESCFAGCNTFRTRWDNAPRGYTSCKDLPPSLESGGTYYVRVTPQSFDSGYDLFFWGTNSPLCTGEMVTGLVASIQDHPVAFAAILVADVVVVAMVGWEAALLYEGYELAATATAVALEEAEAQAADDALAQCVDADLKCYWR